MANQLISILHSGLNAIQAELEEVDTGIETLGGLNRGSAEAHNAAVALLAEGRERLQADKDELKKFIAQTLSRHDHRRSEPSPNDGKHVEVGQCASMKLSTAVQAYLSERNRGPVLLATVARDLTIAGVRVGKELKTVDTRALRLLCANNRKRFSYESEADTISLHTISGNDTNWGTGKRLTRSNPSESAAD